MKNYYDLNDLEGVIDLQEVMTRAPSSTLARQLLENYDIDGYAHDGKTYDDIEWLATASNGEDIVPPSDYIPGWYELLYKTAA